MDITYCNACEEEVSSLSEHYINSKDCVKWAGLLNTPPNSNVAMMIQQMYLNFTNKDSDTCNNCQVKYSNVGNLNKHYKKHPECLKLDLYNVLKIKTEHNYVSGMREFSILDTKRKAFCPPLDENDYYAYWPKSLYNEDLKMASKYVIKYLNNLVNIESPKPLPRAVVLDCDDTLFFGDPESVCGEEGIKDMELGTNRQGNQIFIFPVNREIKNIATEARKLGIQIIILSLRPWSSLDATTENLEMFDVPYDKLFLNKMNVDTKLQAYIDLSKTWEIVCVVGDQQGDCWDECPCSVKLPDPESKKVKIYYNNHPYTNNLVNYDG